LRAWPRTATIERVSLPQLPFLFSYAGDSLDELIAWEGKYRTDSLVLAIEAALLKKQERLGLDRLSEEERIVLDVEALEREVNNGGYHQFFLNVPESARLIVRALSRIHCPIAGGITNRAIELLGIAGPVTKESVRQALSVDPDCLTPLHACDVEYYRRYEPIEERLFAFVKAHRDRIDLR
jgi:hypothetical protein